MSECPALTLGISNLSTRYCCFSTIEIEILHIYMDLVLPRLTAATVSAVICLRLHSWASSRRSCCCLLGCTRQSISFLK